MKKEIKRIFKKTVAHNLQAWTENLSILSPTQAESKANSLANCWAYPQLHLIGEPKQ